MRQVFGLMTVLTMVSCGKKEAQVSLLFPEEYDGKRVELISFEDSVVLADSEIQGTTARFVINESDSLRMPLLVQFVVDGRVKGFYVIEDGIASFDYNKGVAEGTPTNDRLRDAIQELYEAEEAEDFDLLADAAERKFNENKDNVLGSYFGVEWLKWANPLKVDSLLNEAPEGFRDSRRAERYIRYAKLRAKTSPGQPFADFAGKNATGKEIMFSDFIEEGKYTLVDFMASWCPYCIKDMPKLKDIASRYKSEGLNLVSVAVRDTPEATQGAVEKHGLTWDVVYDAQKRPYELYGFSGIPHYMLIGPDGKILYRDGSLEKLQQKMQTLWQK